MKFDFFPLLVPIVPNKFDDLAGAVGYYEASAKTGKGVHETIEFCVRTVQLKGPKSNYLKRIRFVQ